MSRPGKARRSRSASPEHDEDADYQLALQLSKEINGGQATTSGAGPSQQKPSYNDDDDFAYALQLQFGEANGPRHTKGDASAPNRSSRWDQRAPLPKASPRTSKQDKRKVAKYHSETPNGKTFGTFAAFLAHVKSARCLTCEKVFFKSEREMKLLVKDWNSGNMVLTSLLKCTSCEDSRCISCVPGPSMPWSLSSVHGKEVTWCCAGGRTLLLWILLCSLDEHFSAIKLSEAAQRTPKQQPQEGPSQRGRGRGRAGIGFGGSSRPGTGYGSDYNEYLSWGPGHTLSGHQFQAGASNTSGKAKALTTQQNEDQFYQLHLHLIESLLPVFERESNFDMDPPECLAEMLVGSKLLNYCAELLRNDSLEDATKRRDLYHALISLVRTLGAHSSTAGATVYSERPFREDKINLLTLSFHEGSGLWTETSSPLLQSLTNLDAQSELVLQGAKRNEKEFQTAGGQNLLLLCRQITDLRGYLVANSGTSEKSTLPKSKPEIPALTDLPDGAILVSHYYAPSARALISPPSGRFKSLISQITTLKTGLPPGIFVRYAESRPDVQKAVIIGPEGTPYANGIFEFDLFCDANFPNKPPMVQFKTTGGGRVDFNPNLYADGKVCLSLLGTWQGEPWVPGESTLLQVMISIQAMILCEEPWFNEPGREAAYGSRDPSEGPSALYNARTRRNTIRTAMLEWIENTPPMWKDVVDQHFTANADKILHTAVAWSKTKTPDQPYGDVDFSAAGLDTEAMAAMQQHLSAHSREGFDSILPQLQATLYKYGASKIVPDPQPRTQASSAASLKRAREVRKGPPPQLSQLPQLPPMYMPLGTYGPQGPNPQMPHFNYPYMQNPNLQNPHLNTAPQQEPWAQFDNFTLPTLGNFGSSSGLLTGPGRTLGHLGGDGRMDQPGSEAQSNSGRGGSFLSTLGLGRGRYETRSSTRGRGGCSPATNPGVSPVSNSPGFGDHPRGGGYTSPPGRGGYHPDQGRGGGRGHFHDQGRGGRGGQGDGLGRGGRAGRGGFGGLSGF